MTLQLIISEYCFNGKAVKKFLLIIYFSLSFTFLLTEDKKIKKITLIFGSSESKSLKRIINAIYFEINKRAVKFEIKLKYFSFARSYHEVVSGNIDGEVGRVQGIKKNNPEMKTLIQLKESLLEINICFYVKKNDKREYADLNKHKEIKIAYDSGYFIVHKLISKELRVAVDSDAHALEMLLLGRVDGALFLEFNGISTLNLPNDKIKDYKKISFYKAKVSPILNKKHHEHISEFEGIIKAMKKEKLINRLIKNNMAEIKLLPKPTNKSKD